jgi:hypothetical protein
MPARELQERLNSLREQLDRNVPLSEEELAACMKKRGRSRLN